MGVPEQFANRSRSTLVGAIDDTTLSLTVADASSFPTEGNFRVRVDDEIMIVTDVTAEVFDIIRGQESTLAVPHVDGSIITHPLTAEALPLAHKQSQFGAKFESPSGESTPVAFIMPWDGRFLSWAVMNNESGSIIFDVWKDVFASYPPDDTDSITASDKPKTTATLTATGNCTGWDVDFLEGDVLFIVCETADTTASTVILTALRTSP